MQIVIAWAEQTKLVPTGGHVVRDRNLFPEFRLEWEGRAAMWLRNGNKADVAKAKAFANAEGYHVYTFSVTEREPLEKARREAAENAKKAF